jgi:arabinofuranan 3-O-arabinosyltransferase
MQDTRTRDAADARFAAVTGKRLWQAVAFGAAVTLIFTLSMVATAFLTTSEAGVEAGTRALDMDFRTFWAAARLAFQGDPLAAFDMTRLSGEHGFYDDSWLPWVYPPGYLMLITPLGAFSFATSFFVSTLISVGMIAVAVRPFTAGNRAVWLAMALSPAYIAALVIGQNSLLWLACFLAALAALRDDRWILAGVLVGCLTLKPQLGVMIAVALLAAGLWRTILAASITAILLAALPTALVGLEYWPLFLDRLSEQGDRVLSGIGTTDLMVGSFYLMVRSGVAPETALIVQTGVAALCALAVAFVWRSGRVGFDAKAATLVTAIFLSAPYLWFYEAALMPVAGLFLFRAGILGRSAPQLALLLLFWLGAGPQAICVYLGIESRFPWAVIYLPLMLLSLGLCLLHAARLHRLTPKPA